MERELEDSIKLILESKDDDATVIFNNRILGIVSTLLVTYEWIKSADLSNPLQQNILKVENTIYKL